MGQITVKNGGRVRAGSQEVRSGLSYGDRKSKGVHGRKYRKQRGRGQGEDFGGVQGDKKIDSDNS